MIVVQELPQKTRLVLTPNRSLSWLQSKLVIAVIGGFSLSIALIWSLLGAWFILPFAGLEIGLLALVMYIVSSATYQKQTLTIEPERILLECGHGKKHRQLRLRKGTSYLCWTETTHPEDVKKLYILDGSKGSLVGEFLNLDDQKKLIEACRMLGLSVKETKRPILVSF